MKKSLLLLFILLSCTVFGQTISPQSLNFASPTTGTQSFHISAHVASNWSVATSEDWVILNGGGTGMVAMGAGPSDVTVDLSENPSFTDSRETMLTIIITRNTEQTILYSGITQAPSIPVLTISQTEANISSNSSLTPITFTSEDQWTVAMDAWLSLVLSSQANGRTSSINSGSPGSIDLDVVAESNPSSSPRTGTITFSSSNGSVSKTLTINQAGSISTGISEAEENLLNIYPNPSRGTLHIDSQNHTAVKIFDAMGNLIHEEEASTSHVIELTKGLYFLKTGNSSRKVIIE